MLRTLRLLAIGLVVGAIAWWPMLATSKGPTSDGRYVYYQFEIAKAALHHFGEAPLWNPYDCKGIPMWDHPEAMVISPFFVLLLPFSTTVALRIWQLFHIAVGFTGMWLLLRKELEASRPAAAVASAIYVVYAGAAAQYAGLHATLMSFFYLPLLLLLWRRAEHDVRAAIGMGALVALMFYDGATYPLPYGALVLLAETATRAWPLARLRRLAGRAAIVGATAAGLAAARLLPVAERLGQHARDIPPDVDQLLHARTLWRMLTWREPQGFTIVPDQQYWWHEYIVYLGVAGVIVAALGLPFAARRYRWTVLTALATFALMAGHFARWAPWSLLQAHVFPFGSLRVPSRFRHALIIFVCAWIALAIDRVPAWLRERGVPEKVPRIARGVLLSLAIVAAVDTMLLGAKIVDMRYQGDPPKPEPASARFYYGGEGLAPDWMNQPSQNRAWLGCRAYFPSHEQAALWEGDVPQARAVDDAVAVVSSSRTNNTFSLAVDASRPGRVRLNSAYDKHFHTSVGETQNDDDVLAVDVPAGHHEIRIWYWPRLLGLGLAISGTTAAIIALYLVAERRRRQRASAK